jgi:hypothetical protein
MREIIDTFLDTDLVTKLRFSSSAFLIAAGLLIWSSAFLIASGLSPTENST